MFYSIGNILKEELATVRVVQIQDKIRIKMLYSLLKRYIHPDGPFTFKFVYLMMKRDSFEVLLLLYSKISQVN